MDRDAPGTKRQFQVLAISLFVAAAVALSAGAAVAQDVMPVPISAPVGDSAEAVFRDLIWEPVVQAKCVNCHVAGGESGHTRLVFDLDGDAAEHLQSFVDFLDDAEADAGDGHDDHAHPHGHELVLVKIQGAGHGGGAQVAPGSDDFDNMDRFLALLENETAQEEVFHDHISQPVVQAKCINCHVTGGESGHTRLVLVQATEADHEARNLQTFRDLVTAVEADGGSTYILNKIQGVAHGGGVQVAAGSDDFDNMDRFLALLEDEPQGFVARLLEALDAADTSLMFAITTPTDADTVAGDAVAVSATGAPTEAVHFAARPDDEAQDGFAYLGAAANAGAALYAWDTTAMMDGDYELAALYTEDEGDSFTADVIEVSVDNVEPAAAPDIVEDVGRKEQAVQADARHEVVTAVGVMVTLPAGALEADDRLIITVTDTPDAATVLPGDSVGTGVDIALDSGQSAFDEAVTLALPYPEGKPDGIVHGTDIPETELSLWFFDTDADAWERVAGSTVQPDADLVAADVTGTGAYGIFHAPMTMADDDGDDAMEAMTMAQRGGDGGGGCAMLPMVPPGGPPDDPTLIGLLGLATAYLLFGRRRLRHQAATG